MWRNGMYDIGLLDRCLPAVITICFDINSVFYIQLIKLLSNDDVNTIEPNRWCLTEISNIETWNQAHAESTRRNAAGANTLFSLKHLLT